MVNVGDGLPYYLVDGFGWNDDLDEIKGTWEGRSGLSKLYFGSL